MIPDSSPPNRGILSSCPSLSAWLPASLTLKTQLKGGPMPSYLSSELLALTS